MIIHRQNYFELRGRLKEEVQFIQVITGPRQVGKTTMAEQLSEWVDFPCHFSSADHVSAPGTFWISQQWDVARTRTQDAETGLFIIDEIQKIKNWSEVVKAKWDDDRKNERSLHVLILGSSRLQMQEGLTESLTGRFEQIVLPHWSYSEMNEAFGVTLDEFIYFGGYPGSAPFFEEERRWKNYIQNAFIEPTISKDILMLSRVRKPALLKALFELTSSYSGQILSYNKMLGQLHDAGNTTTLADYLELLNQAGLMRGLNKYSLKKVKQKRSSPKLHTYNTALINAQKQESFSELKNDPSSWGRIVENAVGAHLLNKALVEDFEIFYWRERDDEVDFVLQQGNSCIALKVKSGRTAVAKGMSAFTDKFNPEKSLIVGKQGIPLEKFFKMNPANLF